MSNVIAIVIKDDGNIKSINTRDPSLEDVFVDVTSKKAVDKTNINIIDE
ncbi:hypothetical protein [Methanobrevibacter arboriphilus]